MIRALADGALCASLTALGPAGPPSSRWRAGELIELADPERLVTDSGCPARGLRHRAHPAGASDVTPPHPARRESVDHPPRRQTPCLLAARTALGRQTPHMRRGLA